MSSLNWCGVVSINMCKLLMSAASTTVRPVSYSPVNGKCSGWGGEKGAGE
jgi:hypothetical protein